MLLLLCLLSGAVAAEAQIINCEIVRNGKFRIEGSELSYVYMDRRGKSQTEETESGLRIKYRVEWTNECSYNLRITKVEENPEEEAVNLGEVIYVKILSTGNDRYVEERRFTSTGQIKKQLVYFDEM